MNITWNKYYDKIYCIHYVQYQKRDVYINQQLKRVGILDSGIFEYQYTYGSNLDKRFESYFKTKFQPKDDQFNSSVFLGHYKCLRDAYKHNYNRILILEDDVKFIDDLNKIQEILDNTSLEYDVTSYNNTICYQVNRIGIQKLIQLYQNTPIFYKNYFQNDYLKVNTNSNLTVDNKIEKENDHQEYSSIVKLSKTQNIDLNKEIIPTEMNICFSVTYPLFDKLLPIIYSLKKYSQSKLNIYIILDTDFLIDFTSKIKPFKDDRTKIKLIDGSAFVALIDKTFNLSKTRMSYIKLFIPHIFPNLDRILYLDYDTIIANKGLEYFYNIDFQDKFLAVCEDVEADNSRALLCPQEWIIKQSQIFRYLTQHYFSSGVILYNLKKIHNDPINKVMTNTIQLEPPTSNNNEELQQVWKILESSKMQPQLIQFQFCDQSVLNFIFRNDVKIVSPIFNNTLYTMHNPLSKSWLKEQWGFESQEEFMTKSIIYHFVFDKPWEIRVNDLNYHKCNKYKLQAVDFYKNLEMEMELK